MSDFQVSIEVPSLCKVRNFTIATDIQLEVRSLTTCSQQTASIWKFRLANQPLSSDILRAADRRGLAAQDYLRQ